MNPARDALYQVHQLQAQRLGQAALPYEEFCARLKTVSETDLTGLFLPPSGITIEIQGRRRARFNLGRLCITPSAATVVPADEMLKAIHRHAAGDWGAPNPHVWRVNDLALLHGGRLFSAYETRAGRKFWVITEADRTVTTVLLPEEY